MKVLICLALTLTVAAGAVTAIRLSHDAAAGTISLGPTRTPTPSRTPAKPTPTPTPTPAPPPRTPTGAAVGPGLMVAECIGAGPDAVRATLLWNTSGAGTQYVDLSIFNNGFAPGTFVNAGAFAPSVWGYAWSGLRQGTTHFARVNTLTKTGWQPSATLAFFTPVCKPSAYFAHPGDDMLALRDRISAAIDASGIDTAVAITDLRTRETVDVNGAATRLPGCTINLFGLIRVVVDLQEHKYPEPEPGDLIGQTINRSDPITARRLVRDWVGEGDLGLGMQRVNDFMEALGMNETLMDHPPAFPEESLDGGASNRITALDANRGLQALWDGRVLNPFWRDYMLYKMTLVKPGLNYLIAAGAGAGATVSHKNGFLYEEGWADNDIGIVWYERGGERYGYAISFFTENVPGKYDDIPVGQQVASLAYRWFTGRYGYP